MKTYRLRVDDREVATILAALRFWQANVDEDERRDLDGHGHFEQEQPLFDHQIDELCERINLVR